MPRTVNEAMYAARRNAILDAAERAIAGKGYEQMAIGDILAELNISSGAFYHYFDSKPALLTALVERRGEQLAQRVSPIIHDPQLGAIEKLQRFFAVLDGEKRTNRRFVLAFIQVWYGDENALVRHKLYTSRLKRVVPWLEEMIRQGTREGVLTTPYPDYAARALLALLEDLAYATAELLLQAAKLPDDLARFERIVTATADAMERVLGAPAGCLQLQSREDLARWLEPSEKLVEQETADL